MGHDPRQYVQPGQPLRIAAAQINALNNLSRTAGRMSGILGNQWPPASNVLLASNETGSTVPRFGVMELGGVHVNFPVGADGEGAFSACPVISGTKPSDSRDAPWCVAVDPIPSGAIGRVAVGGAVLARVDIKSTSHTRVRPKPDDAESLESCFVGRAAILSQAAGVSDGQLCVIQFAGYERTLWFGATHEISYPGTSVDVYLRDSLGNETEETLVGVRNYATPVFPNVPVIVASVPGDGTWSTTGNNELGKDPFLHIISTEMPNVLRGVASGSWWKGEEKNIQITIGNDTTSIQVHNPFSDVDATGSYSVAVAWSNDEWILLAAECPPPPESP